MINAIIFSLLVAMLVYIILKYFGIWLGCVASLVYIIALVCVPIMTLFIAGTVVVTLAKLIIGLL